MRFWTGSRLALVAMLALPTSAHAANTASAGDDTDVITVTATRLPVAVEDAPATVSVIDAQRIADELVTDIKDLVRYEPGVSVARAPARFGAALGATGRDRNAGITIRGIGGNRVLTQVDGVRVPDGFAFGAQQSGRGDYVDLGLVKSVEILRGPASALYGSDGLSGVVSYTTSDPADIIGTASNGTHPIGGSVQSSYSSADREFAETAILAAGTGPWSGLIAYTRRDFQELANQGTRDVTGPSRTTPNPQDGRSNALLGKLVWRPAGGHRLRLTGEHLDSRIDSRILSGLSATVDRLDARDTTARDRVSLDWSWTAADAGATGIDHAAATLYWQDGENRQFTAEDRTPAADRTRLNSFRNRVVGASAELHARVATGPIGHRLVLGGDLSRTRQDGIRDGTVPPVGETFPTRAFPVTNFTLAGVFLGDEIALADGAVTLYPALRFDHYRLDPTDDPLLPGFRGAGQSGSRLSPKFGAVVALGGGFSAFGQYAHGFKAPAPGQVNQFFENLAFGYTSIPNPDLGPERSRTVEAGLRYAGTGLSVALTAFSARYRDFISQQVVSGGFTPADPAVYQFVNLDRARVRGVEGKLQARFGAGFTADAAFGYATGDVIDPTGARLPLASVDPVKLVAGLGYRDPGGRFGGQLVMTHSVRKAERRTRGLCTPACFRPDGFTLIDATAFVRVADAVTLRAGVFNLLDETYVWWSDVAGLAGTSTITDAFTQPGRNLSLSATARF